MDSVVAALRLWSGGSVVSKPQLSCSQACGIFLAQESNPCFLQFLNTGPPGRACSDSIQAVSSLYLFFFFLCTFKKLNSTIQTELDAHFIYLLWMSAQAPYFFRPLPVCFLHSTSFGCVSGFLISTKLLGANILAGDLIFWLPLVVFWYSVHQTDLPFV